MSQVLTVPTHFNDIGELSEGFLDRVEKDTLILYGPVAYEEGSEIEFAVLLADGSRALEGAGRVRAAVDGGADRVPETRYDVVVEALQLDGRCEVVLERLVLARQAASDHPPAEGEEPATNDMDDATAQDDPDEPVIEAVEDSAPDTVPPEALDDDEDDDEPATVIAAVDAEAMMAAAEAEAEPASEPAPEAESETELETELAAGSDAPTFDADYAFEHGIAAEPQVGRPVPIPSMAVPPEAPPAPPTLRLAEPPKGLTRPSLAQVEESLFNADGEVSDVHTTGLFVYEDGLPIPSRPPLPDPNRPRSVAPVEAAGRYDVEESEPPETNDDEYEEVRLSDFAEAADEG
jgi:hypothetical protein